MKGFKEFVSEGYPTWVKITTAGLVLRIRNLSAQIKGESDLMKQNALISQQNKLISYISGLGIAVSSDDVALMNRLKALK